MFQAHEGGLFNYSKVNRRELKWQKIMDGIRQISALFPSRNLQRARERERERERVKMQRKKPKQYQVVHCFSFVSHFYVNYT